MLIEVVVDALAHHGVLDHEDIDGERRASLMERQVRRYHG